MYEKLKKKLKEVTYASFGTSCNDLALKVSKRDNHVQQAADIRVQNPCPPLPKHKRFYSYEKLLHTNFSIFGAGGTGKSKMLQEIADLLRDKKPICFITYQNSVASKFNGITIHQFCRRMNSGKTKLPCLCIIDEIFYPNMYVLSRLVHFFALPEIQWIFAGDWAQMQAHGHWRGQLCSHGLYNHNGSFSC